MFFNNLETVTDLKQKNLPCSQNPKRSDVRLCILDGEGFNQKELSQLFEINYLRN